MIKRSRFVLYYLPIFLTIALGVLNTISAVTAPQRDRLDILRTILPRDISLASRGLVLIIGFLLLVLSYGLVRRSKAAWRATMLLAVISVFGHLGKGIDYDASFFSAVVLYGLYLSRDFYRRQTDHSSIRKGLRILAVCLLSLLVYGYLGFYFLDRHNFGESFHIVATFKHLVRLYITFGDPNLIPHTRFARTFLMSLYTAASVSWVISAYYLLRPALERFQRHPAEQELATQLIQQYGKSSLDYFKVAPDKRYFFSSNNLAFLAYTLIDPTILVLGDPVGSSKENIRLLLEEFQHYVVSHGWRFAFQQVSEQYISLYADFGWQALKIGEEAEVPLKSLTLEGPQAKEFRTTLRKMERDGFSVKQYDPPLNGGLIQKLQQVSGEWNSLPGRTDRSFAQTAFQPQAIKQCPVATVEDSEGQVVAFISLILNYAPHALALDLLRRRQKIPNGAIDLLILQTGFYYQERGYETFSLGLAPLAGLGKGEETTLPEKALKLFYENMNQIFSYRGLREFKAKFNPNWRPRYMVYRYAYQLPALGLAALKASQVKNRRY